MKHPPEPPAPTPMCAACGELPPEPLEPFVAAGMPTWRCVYPSTCLARAQKRLIGMWNPNLNLIAPSTTKETAP